MTKVIYPSGRFITYSYGPGGQVTQIADSTGFVQNFAYDAAGRLASVADGAGHALVAYQYDSTGHISRKNLGNGTYTTFEYDPAGQILHDVNYSPSGEVQSRFDYTYAAAGQRAGMTTMQGQWAYSYDDAGRLVHAVFTPAAKPACRPSH